MKGCLGIIQIGLGIGGVIALLNGAWWLLLAAFGASIIIGILGSLYVKATEGVSQIGQDAIKEVGSAIQQLRQGNLAAANNLSRSAIRSFKFGGDKMLLPLALTVHAVTLAALGEIDASKKALAESSQLLKSMPVFAELDDKSQDFIDETHRFLEKALNKGVKDPARFVEKFLEINDL
ncbi:MAG: hypothetical protein WBA28_04230 [Microbacteriaceae bacterium]